MQTAGQSAEAVAIAQSAAAAFDETAAIAIASAAIDAIRKMAGFIDIGGLTGDDPYVILKHTPPRQERRREFGFKPVGD